MFGDMMSVVYAECHKNHFVHCYYAECSYADCPGFHKLPLSLLFSDKENKILISKNSFSHKIDISFIHAWEAQWSNFTSDYNCLQIS